MDLPRIPSLAAEIAARAADLSKAEQGSEDAKRALAAIKTASHNLEVAATQPADWLYGMGWSTNHLAAVVCLLEFKAVQSVPLEDGASIAYSDLAAQVGVKQDILERLCRYTATSGFLREVEPGRVEHTPTSKLATEFPEALIVQSRLWLSACFRMRDALEYDASAEDPSTCAMALAKRKADGTCPTFWEWLDEDADDRDGFAQMMQLGAMTGRIGTAVDAFDWGSLPQGSTVVDVGGGRGHMMQILAKKYPSLHFVVQDKASVVSEMDHHHDSAHVEFMAHDFFEPQPLQAEAYFFSRILHDWPDQWCKKILSATVSAMKPGSKLIISDIILPEPSGQLNYTEWGLRSLDIVMHVLFNSKERSLSQWKTLVSGTEPRLKFEMACTPRDSELGIVVFTFQE